MYYTCEDSKDVDHGRAVEPAGVDSKRVEEGKHSSGCTQQDGQSDCHDRSINSDNVVRLVHIV